MRWSYNITWSELTEREKRHLFLIAGGNDDNQSLIKKLNISKDNLAIYKAQLAKQGIIDIETRGKSKFALPRFDSFVLFQKKLLDE